MGCVCCSLSSFISILLHSLERISLCTVCALLVCCILFTILAVLVMGIGIGFHYCVVQNSVEAMAAAAKAASSVEAGGRRRSEDGGGGPALKDSRKKQMLASVKQAVKRGFAHRLGRRDRADELMPSNNNTINDIMLAANNTLANSTFNQTLPFDSYDNHDLITPSNDTVYMVPVQEIHNETPSFMRKSIGDAMSILRQTFGGPSRRRRQIADINDTAINLTDANQFKYEEMKLNSFDTNLTLANIKMESNSTFEVYAPNKELSGTPASFNASIQDIASLRQNCTLLNFFSLFF